MNRTRVDPNICAMTWENKGGAEGCCQHPWLLTRSLDQRKEGLPMKGNSRTYVRTAARRVT